MSTALRAGYKQTEVGVIPEEWDVAAIGDKTEKVGSGITPTGGQRVYRSEGRPFMRSQNVGWGNLLLDDVAFIDEATHSTFSETEIQLDDVFLNITGASIGRSAIADSRLVGGNVNQHVCIIRAKQSNLFPRYLNVFLLSAAGQRQIDSFQAGGNRQGLNFAQVRSMRIPLPATKAEQRAIAAALSDVDALLGGLDRLIAKKRDLKQAAMQQLLTGQTRLPGFHGEWEVKRLGDLAEMGSGGTPLSSVPTYYDGNIPWVAISDMTKGGKIIESTERNLTTLGLANSAAQMFPAGTVLYAMYASLGECSIAGVSLCTSQAILGIRPKSNLNAGFLYYYLTSLKSVVKTLGQQGTQSNLNKGMVQDFRLNLPTLPEQTAIAAILSDMDAELSKLMAKRDKTRALKQAMMQELLTGKTRLVAPSSNVVPVDFSPKPKLASVQQPATGSHNWQINEAVVVAMLVKWFGTEQYPLGRKRCTKLSYLLHRHVEHVAPGYLKKAAGPYNPAVKYKGPEGIAQKNGYIRTHTNGKFSGFVVAEKILQAETYFNQWYGHGVLVWLEPLRYASNDELELLATVDMALEDLRRVGTQGGLEAVKSVIRDHPEWEAKLEREIFSDPHIVRAIKRVGELFAIA